MELELAGLHDITPQGKEIVDAYSERDNKVDWEQRVLTHIDPEPQEVSTNTVTLDDTHQQNQQHRLSPSKVALTDDGDDAATDSESVFRLYGQSFLLPSTLTTYASCYDAGGDPESFARGRPTLGNFNCRSYAPFDGGAGGDAISSARTHYHTPVWAVKSSSCSYALHGVLAGLLIPLPKHFILHHTVMSTGHLPPPVWLHHLTRLHLPHLLHPILPHILIHTLVNYLSAPIHYLQ